MRRQENGGRGGGPGILVVKKEMRCSKRDVGLRLGHYFFKSALMATDAPCGHALPATLPFPLTSPFQGLCFSPAEV